MRKLLCAIILCFATLTANATNRTQITTLGPNDPANLLTFNTNFINLRATADAIYNDAGTPLNTNLYLWTNSIEGIKNMVGTGGGYITNFAEIWVGTQRVTAIVVGTGSVDSASVARWDSNYNWYVVGSTNVGYLSSNQTWSGINTFTAPSNTFSGSVYVTNSLIVGDPSGTNSYTSGTIRLAGSTSSDKGIRFGNDTYLYRSGVGVLSAGTTLNATYFQASGWVYAPYYIGVYLGDFETRLNVNNSGRFIWTGGIGTTNYMSLTNNAGIGQLEVGNVKATNRLEYFGTNITDMVWTTAQLPAGVVTNGGTVTSLYTSKVITDGFAGSELASCDWTRSLLSGGDLLYNVTNRHPANINWFVASKTTNDSLQVRSYTNGTTNVVGQYLGFGIMSTTTYNTVYSPMTVKAFLSLTTAGGVPTPRSFTIHPEFYWSTDGTNLFGDFEGGVQTISTTNISPYTWTIPFPTITNTMPMYLVRRFKIDAVAGSAPVLNIYGSGQYKSEIGFTVPPNSDSSLGVRGATNVVTGASSSYDTVNRVMTLGSFTNISSIGMDSSGGVTNGSFRFVLGVGNTNCFELTSITNGVICTNRLPISL